MRYLLEYEVGRNYVIRYDKNNPYRTSLDNDKPSILPIIPTILSAIFFLAGLSLLLPAMAKNKATKIITDRQRTLETLLHRWVDIVCPDHYFDVKGQISLLIHDREAYVKQANVRHRDSLFDDMDNYEEIKDEATPALIWLEFIYFLAEEQCINLIDWKQCPSDIFSYLDNSIVRYLSRTNYRTIKDIADKAMVDDDAYIPPHEYFPMIQDALKDTPLRLFFILDGSDSYIFTTLTDDKFAELSALTEQIKTFFQPYNPNKYPISISTEMP